MVVKLQYFSGWFLIINSLVLFVITSVGLGIDYEELRPSLFSTEMLDLVEDALGSLLLTAFGLLFAWWMFPYERKHQPTGLK